MEHFTCIVCAQLLLGQMQLSFWCIHFIVNSWNLVVNMIACKIVHLNVLKQEYVILLLQVYVSL